ncbi:MAG: NupC/NupG family nucleoside CNT transporter, partial [Planctomycetes bacterium]|nr:NupC/NupG family nucleoside CNT transporter [Planctomycetota bacterium]
ILNEFLAYIDLAGMKADISPRAVTLATYALCGFANFSSIAIQIGGISGLEEGIRPKLAKLGLLSMVGGTIATLMTAAVVAVFL